MSSCEASRPGGMKWSGRAASRASSTAGDGARCTKKSAGACSRNASRYRLLSAEHATTTPPGRLATASPTSSSHGQRSSSSSGTPADILRTFDAGCRSSASMYATSSAAANARAIVVLPAPATPITAIWSGAPATLTSRGPCRREAGYREGRPARTGTSPLHRRSVRHRDPDSRRGGDSRRSR